MGLSWGEQEIEIAAAPEDCFATITDYETFADWQDAVETVEVLDRDPEGRGRRVRFEVDARLRTVSYTLDYSYEQPERIRWELDEGDGVEAVEGGYELGPLDSGNTRARYRLGIDPGVPVPGLIARRLNQGVMRRSVEDLRNEVERRVAAGAPG